MPLLGFPSRLSASEALFLQDLFRGASRRRYWTLHQTRRCSRTGQSWAPALDGPYESQKRGGFSSRRLFLREPPWSLSLTRGIEIRVVAFRRDRSPGIGPPAPKPAL